MKVVVFTHNFAKYWPFSMLCVTVSMLCASNFIRDQAPKRLQ